MNQGLNKVLVVGKLSKIEQRKDFVRQTNEEKTIYNLSVELSREGKNGRVYSDVIVFTAFGDQNIPAEGSSVFITGRIQSRSFDGVTSYKFVVESIYEIKQ